MSLEGIKFGEKDYAFVPARLKKFREENPRADVDTEQIFNPDSSITFRTRITKDLSDEHSARSTGSARYTEVEMKKPKAFEKLETISVGRALANLGYLNDGQIATTEEMEEFESFKQDKVESAVEEIKKSTKRSEFEAIIAKLSASQQKELAPVIKARMQELKNAQ